ncbi:calcium channel subunit Mid1 [Rhodotorula toruloides]|uniref:Calcium channel subunit Mid1 n=1 Tax=Rhodotorula toruloides TaxID=5286 RepID=A0A511KM00_RHOTO|nr:calcium channel subunit Mid1 [Rhodotorula toruloides]
MLPRIRRPTNYRRRPPRATGFPLISLAVSLVLLVLSATGTAAQSVTTLTDPSTTTVRVDSAGSALYFLPSSSSTNPPIYVSLSLCSIPSSLAHNTSITLPPVFDTVLYVSTTPYIKPYPSNASTPDDLFSRGDSLATSQLSYGYANVTLEVTEGGGGIYVAVFAPDTSKVVDPAESSVTGQWHFELDISSGTTEPPYVARGRTGLRTEDTDMSSVLLSTAKWMDEREAPPHVPIVAPTNSLSLALSRSKCFVRSMARQSVAVGASLNASTTTRGWPVNGTRAQYWVDGLGRASNYTAWLVENATMSDGGGANQTQVWDPVFFATKSTDSCRLVYGIDVCPSVAYSVPAPASIDTPSLISFFNSSISASLANFTRTMTTFPCGLNDGQYSVVSTCDDCITAYRDYLCAMTMPRCTDAPSNVTLNDTTTTVGASLPSYDIPSRYTNSLIRTDPFASRTPLFGPSNLSSTFPTLFNSTFRPTRQNLLSESPFPYTETPPCLDICYLVEARCPPFLKWWCPKDSGGTPSGGTGSAAYGVTVDVPGADRMGGDVRGSELGTRAADRWGNVYCNALYSDLTMAAQFAPPSNAAPLALSIPRILAFGSVVVSVSSMLCS